MVDQVNFEAARPVSADPAVALAEALGQLPQTPLKAPKVPSPKEKLKLEPKVSVESLAQELGLKLGDQNELTIRRIKRGKNYSFIRANGTAIRHVGTIKRLNSMAVPSSPRGSAARRRNGGASPASSLTCSRISRWSSSSIPPRLRRARRRRTARAGSRLRSLPTRRCPMSCAKCWRMR